MNLITQNKLGLSFNAVYIKRKPIFLFLLMLYILKESPFFFIFYEIKQSPYKQQSGLYINV